MLSIIYQILFHSLQSLYNPIIYLFYQLYVVYTIVKCSFSVQFYSRNVLGHD
uniref:Uncharacterized protein n=1 Tax=Arundo donax TaxID=35708 RepID=A0A0A9B203_ARUDO